MTLPPLLFEKDTVGQKAHLFPDHRVKVSAHAAPLPDALRRKTPPALPALSQLELVRHFTNLAHVNFSVDTGFYPLGSCTMKYNPKVNDELALLAGFAGAHPYQPAETVQGLLALLWDLEQWLCTLTGMARFSLQPAAGAHGELCAMMMARSFFQGRGERQRQDVLVPDSSHGTNPASAALLGFRVVELKSSARGRVDVRELAKLLGPRTACLMLTNPNTLGLFEDDILEITRLSHAAGALTYYDGANMNALLALCRPGDMGFDMLHLNLHKTFSTPHGGGGPGSGPVGVARHLIPFLPRPLVEKKAERYELDGDRSQSIGRLKCFYGNVGILVRAYVYIRALGLSGLAQVSRDAILSANYLKKKLEGAFEDPYPEPCMHEFVLSARAGAPVNVHAIDIGKRLLDFSFYAPTVHFPLIVPEALMIEPTETESRRTLDGFAEALWKIRAEIDEDPNKLRSSPHTAAVKRVGEVEAARNPCLTVRDLRAACRPGACIPV